MIPTGTQCRFWQFDVEVTQKKKRKADKETLKQVRGVAPATTAAKIASAAKTADEMEGEANAAESGLNNTKSRTYNPKKAAKVVVEAILCHSCK